MQIYKNKSHNLLLSQCFLPESIPKEVIIFNQNLSKELAELPSLATLSPEAIRARDQSAIIRRLPQASDRFITGPSKNSIKLRQFIPPKINGVYLYFHGGGWISGSADMQDEYFDWMANRCHLAVISVEYRLAPEHPFPEPLDDCEAATIWLIENIQREFGSKNIILGGGSAGAHLCVLTLLRMRDKHFYTDFKAVNLVYGIYDLGMTASMRNWGETELILSTPIVEKLINYFLPAGTDPSNPNVSPLYAELSNMPPALFTIGTMDPLLDDSLFMYMRWISAANNAEIIIAPGGIHGFLTLQTPQANEIKEKIINFLKVQSKPKG